jgi:hypothetical protein
MGIDDDDLDHEDDGEALAWECALSKVSMDLWRVIGHYAQHRIPVESRQAGDRWLWPRLDEAELTWLRLVLAQERVVRCHEQYIIWAVQQSERT